MNYNQVHKIDLNPNVVDCIIFWTKNPKDMMDNLYLLKDYHFYFQFTLNPYDKTIESRIPEKSMLIHTFMRLSDMIGKNRIIWRYDPIILSSNISKHYHYEHFEYLAEKIHKFTNKCVISFIDLYVKTKRNVKDLNLMPITTEDMREIALNLASIVNKYGITIETCCEQIELGDLGIRHGKCIDDKLISEIIGVNLSVENDKNQRQNCGCVKSIDIGAYNTCEHGCLYCYANFSRNTVINNVKKHDSQSPMLIGNLRKDDKVYIREMFSYREKQLSI